MPTAASSRGDRDDAEGIGRCEAFVDNSGGADDAVTVKARRGTFRWANSAAGDAITAADIGSDCYIVDDQTVAKTNGTNTRSVAGKIMTWTPWASGSAPASDGHSLSSQRRFDMQLNQASLRTLFIGFNAAFKTGLDSQAASQFSRVATVVPSTTREQDYGWLGKIPNVRQWIGDRVVHNITQAGYTIRNLPSRSRSRSRRTISRTTTSASTARSSPSSAPRRLALRPARLRAAEGGFSTTCYDKQYFFDTDHPVIAEDGLTINSVANTDGGSGAPGS